MDRVGSPAAALRRVGRDGALALRVERRGGGSVVAASRFTLPLQILAPVALDDPAVVVSVLNPTGGLVGGDRLTIDVGVGPDAHACLTTPSATKVYRTTGEPAEQDVRMRLGAGATVEWVPDHTIPFAGSSLRQRLDVELGEGARAIVVDAFAAGRVARGETWAFAHLESALTVRDAKGWRFHDRFVLRAGAGHAGLGRAEAHPYFATVALLGPLDLAPVARAGATTAATTAGLRVGVGALPRDGAVARVLAASAPALLAAIDAVWAAGRRALLGLPPLALRKG